MEAYRNLVIVALVLVAAIGFEAKTANSEISICHMTKDGLKACEASVRSIFPAPPSAACCSALSGADMQCFCQFKNSNILLAYGIDFNQAMQLPAKCDLAQSSFHC